MSPRVYVRKFDWEEARSLHAAGVSGNEIAKRMGVTPGAIYRILSPENYETERIRRNAWYKEGVCPDCGGPSTKLSAKESARCMACAAKLKATSVRPDSLRCSTCQEWKPDTAFPRNRSDQHRRGRHGQCTPCQTLAKRAYRRRHPEYRG